MVWPGLRWVCVESVTLNQGNSGVSGCQSGLSTSVSYQIDRFAGERFPPRTEPENLQVSTA